MKVVLFLLLFLPLFVTAQDAKTDSVTLKASLSMTGFYQGGNVDTYIFRAKSDVSFQPTKSWVLKTINSYVYQEFGKTKADEDILSLNFIHFNPHRKFYPLVLGFVSTNYRREIDLRYLLGAGITYQALNQPKYVLKFSITSEFERTNFGKTDFNRSQYDGQTSIKTFRGTLWVNGSYSLFNKKVILKHEFYAQPSLQESDNFRWQADFGLDFPIWKYLNFKINYLHTVESVVITNQKQVDNIMSFGFTLKNF